MEDRISSLIIELLYEILNFPDGIDLTEKLEWDSFDKMRFVMRIEEELQIDLDEVLFDIVKAKDVKELTIIIMESMGGVE